MLILGIRSEAEELVGPHEDTVNAVHEWLEGHGINSATDVSRNSAGDWISVRLPLERVEKMLEAEYKLYRHSETGEGIVRTLSYSLPRDLHDHIDLVQPTTMFDNMRKMRATFHVNDGPIEVSDQLQSARPDLTGPAGQNISASCNTTITPTCLMQLYRTEGYVPQAADKGNRVGVTGYLEQVRNLDVRLGSDLIHNLLQFVNFADLQVGHDRLLGLRPLISGIDVLSDVPTRCSWLQCFGHFCKRRP